MQKKFASHPRRATMPAILFHLATDPLDDAMTSRWLATFILIAILSGLLLTACAPAPETAPTATPAPPTATPVPPTDTPTSEPTATPEPTETPTPTPEWVTEEVQIHLEKLAKRVDTLASYKGVDELRNAAITPERLGGEAGVVAFKITTDSGKEFYVVYGSDLTGAPHASSWVVLPEDVLAGISNRRLLPITERGYFLGYLDQGDGKTYHVAAYDQDKKAFGFPEAEVYENKQLEVPVYAVINPGARLYGGPGTGYEEAAFSESKKGRHKVLKSWEDEKGGKWFLVQIRGDEGWVNEKDLAEFVVGNEGMVPRLDESDVPPTLTATPTSTPTPLPTATPTPYIQEATPIPNAINEIVDPTHYTWFDEFNLLPPEHKSKKGEIDLRDRPCRSCEEIKGRKIFNDSGKQITVILGYDARTNKYSLSGGNFDIGFVQEKVERQPDGFLKIEISGREQPLLILPHLDGEIIIVTESSLGAANYIMTHKHYLDENMLREGDIIGYDPETGNILLVY